MWHYHYQISAPKWTSSVDPASVSILEVSHLDGQSLLEQIHHVLVPESQSIILKER